MVSVRLFARIKIAVDERLHLTPQIIHHVALHKQAALAQICEDEILRRAFVGEKMSGWKLADNRKPGRCSRAPARLRLLTAPS
jgi:hypothetical protein